jgi:hypothetical protein
VTKKKLVNKSSKKAHSRSKQASKVRFFTLLRTHKLVVFLLLVLALFPASYGYEKYKDWDNAQFIKGIAQDFPELVTDIEAATGLDLEEKTDCMITTEKFSSGVRTCELFFGLQASQEDVDKAFSVISSNDKFKQDRQGENGLGYYYKYRNKDSCSFLNTGRIAGSCIFAIRDANIQLAKDTLKSK